MNSFRFLFWNVITGFIWSATWVLVGYFAGKSFELVAKYVGWGIMIATVISIVLWFVVKFINAKKHIFTKYHIFLLLCNIASIYVFLEIFEEVLNGDSIVMIDNYISTHIHFLWNSILNVIMISITNFGGTISVSFISIGIVLYLYKKAEKKQIIFML